MFLIHKLTLIQPRGELKTNYWSSSHDPATVFTDVLLSPSSLLLCWTLAASYQDIGIIKGFSSSRLPSRFESMKDEKKQNSTA